MTKREIITKVYRKPTHTGQSTQFSSKQPLHVKLSTVKTPVRRAKFICTDETSSNEEISSIRKTMQLNGCLLNVIIKQSRTPCNVTILNIKAKNWNH